jgi:hypothetical protein
MNLKSWYVEYLTGSEVFCISEGYWNSEDDYHQNVELTFHTSLNPTRTPFRGFNGVVTLWPRHTAFEYSGGEDYE